MILRYPILRWDRLYYRGFRNIASREKKHNILQGIKTSDRSFHTSCFDIQLSAWNASLRNSCNSMHCSNCPFLSSHNSSRDTFSFSRDCICRLHKQWTAHVQYYNKQITDTIDTYISFILSMIGCLHSGIYSPLSFWLSLS